MAIKPYEHLIDHVKNNTQKGDLLTHAQIETITGVNYRKGCNHVNGDYNAMIRKANDVLTSVGMRLQSIKGYGYRVAFDKDYAEMARVSYNTGQKFIQKAMFILDNTNVSNLKGADYTEYMRIHGIVNNACSYIQMIPSSVIPAINKKKKP